MGSNGGDVEGQIADKPRGSGGSGIIHYWVCLALPWGWPSYHGREARAISHRGGALAKLLHKLGIQIRLNVETRNVTARDDESS